MKKIFYEDCHAKTFSACVTGCESSEKGYLVTLDATAFYPGGGGQACDIGTLDDVRVLDVWEKDGNILHLCDGALEVGKTVTGTIDWSRRFDLMQQHTGEHIVSGLIHENYGYHNTGFHVGKDVMEVDFDGPLPAAELTQIEARANEAVWANLPVKCWTPEPEVLQTLFYRTKRLLPWPVRIVQVPGFDSCACCGVHVGSTGEVGLIKILSCTKFHGGVRLEMVCGSRAYRHMVKFFEENRQVSQAFSVPMDATGEAARKMNELLAAEKSRVTGLRNQLFSLTAERYVNRKDILHFEKTLEPGQVRELAEQIAGVCQGFAAVFAGEGDSFRYCLASREEDLRPLNQALTARFSGRGGGKPQFQQGSVRADKSSIEAFFRGL